MSRKYYVWKDPACGGKNIEWQVLSGAEFYTMMQLPENKSRRFIPFFDEDYEDVDTIYIEATVAQYKSWRKEYDKYRYSQTTSKPYSVLSIHCPVPESENIPLVETIQDETMDTEASAIDLIQSEKVRTIMSALPPKDRWLVEEIYMRQRSTVSIAAELGLNQSVVYRRATRILKKIKKILKKEGIDF